MTFYSGRGILRPRQILKKEFIRETVEKAVQPPVALEKGLARACERT